MLLLAAARPQTLRLLLELSRANAGPHLRRLQQLMHLWTVTDEINVGACDCAACHWITEGDSEVRSRMCRHVSSKISTNMQSSAPACIACKHTSRTPSETPPDARGRQKVRGTRPCHKPSAGNANRARQALSVHSNKSVVSEQLMYCNDLQVEGAQCHLPPAAV